MTDPLIEYRRRYETHLKTVALRLKSCIKDCLADVQNIDRVTARAKDPSSFTTKAQLLDNKGNNKYKKPLTEIQDQIGVRVVVDYLDNISCVESTIIKNYRAIEQKDLVPESQWSFGYFGKHLILALPRDVIPEKVKVDEVPSFFELQIKTLFQHAWSAANHDLVYKPQSNLSADQERLCAYAAAQAWGADHIFKILKTELNGKVGVPPQQVPAPFKSS